MSEPRVSRRPALLVFVALLLALESTALVGVACYLVIELLTARPDSYASAIAILVLVILAASWLVVLTLHTLRGRSWIRGGAITWQVLQVAIGIGSFSGPFSRPDIGWLLIVPAVAVIVLLFTPAVIAATRRDGAADSVEQS